MEKRLSIPALEVNFPRPRERTLGGDGGGGGPTMEARGSESEAALGVGERARFVEPFVDLACEPLVAVDALFGRLSISVEDEYIEGDLRRWER